ncbi:MAG: C45 family autoproteolytic acyltransferase/hydrolase [Pseudomonadota bacterium]
MGKRGIFHCMVYLFSIFFLLTQLTGCDNSSDSRPAVNSAEDIDTPTPEPYVSTGFPQVVVVSGTNYEMGVQYGNQSAPAIYHNLTIFKSKLYAAFGSDTVSEDMKVWDYYLMQHDPTLKDWLDGIVKGCENKGYKVSYLNLILLMVYPTELWSRPGDYPPEWGAQSKSAGAAVVTEQSSSYHSCNSLAATGSATPDGKPVHAITQMAGTEMMDNIILIAFPNSGHSFVSQGYAGRVNANSAMNSNGLAWSMTAILSDAPVWGLTEVYFHYLAQIASTRTEAIDYLKNTPRGGVAGGFILSDSTDIEVFETQANVYAQRTPVNGFVVQANHLVSTELLSYNPSWLNYIGTYERYNTVFQHLTEAGAGAVTADLIKTIFSSDDWYDAVAAEWHYNEPGSPFLSNDHTSVSESIFFPADLIAYFATGTASGNGIPVYATGEYVKIRLATDPKLVTNSADTDALAYYWNAADFFEHELNAEPAYLTAAVIEDVQADLDEAMYAYSVGIDRAAYAYFEDEPGLAAELWGAALTNFSKAQLYAQMAKTKLLRADTGTPQ